MELQQNSTTIYFNPRSYKRSDKILLLLVNLLTISIHAPTRGATSVFLASSIRSLFQSTLLQEERHHQKVALITFTEISIHAPTRGATAKMHNIPYASLQ